MTGVGTLVPYGDLLLVLLILCKAAELPGWD